MRIAKVLEQFDLLWLEIDMYDHEAIRQSRIPRRRRYALVKTSITCANIFPILNVVLPMCL